MVNHEYWLEIFPNEIASHPWKVLVTETRNYTVVENVLLRTDQEVIDKVRSYLRRYGKENIKIGEHVYYVGPRFKKEMLLNFEE